MLISGTLMAWVFLVEKRSINWPQPLRLTFHAWTHRADAPMVVDGSAGRVHNQPATTSGHVVSLSPGERQALWYRTGRNSRTCTPSLSEVQAVRSCSCPTTTDGRYARLSRCCKHPGLVQTLKVDIALVDRTFWSADELSGRSQSEVPHPPVAETLERLGSRQETDPGRFHPSQPHQSALQGRCGTSNAPRPWVVRGPARDAIHAVIGVMPLGWNASMVG